MGVSGLSTLYPPAEDVFAQQQHDTDLESALHRPVNVPLSWIDTPTILPDSDRVHVGRSG